MKTLKPIYLSAAFAFALVSCGGAKQMVSTPIGNIDNLPLKITPLAENDLKRWSHLDLVKDTVPGMSVDKAYAELLKGKKSTTVIVGIVPTADAAGTATATFDAAPAVPLMYTTVEYPPFVIVIVPTFTLVVYA